LVGRWQKDTDDVMYYITNNGGTCCSVLGLSPELIAEAYNFNRACIYRWLRQYDEGGYKALESRMPPGAKPLLSDAMDEWLRQTVLTLTPVKFGYDTNLWTGTVFSRIIGARIRCDGER